MALRNLLMVSANQSGLIYVGSAMASNGSGNPFSVSLTSLTGGAGSSAATGDIVIVASNNAGAASVPSYMSVTGYTLIDSRNATSGSQSTALWVGYKVMGATPDTTVSIPGTGSSNRGGAAAVHVWRSQNATPMDVTAVTSAATSSAKPDPASITPVTSGAIVLAAGGASHTRSSATFTSSDLSNFRTVGANVLVSNSSIGLGSLAWTSGAVDPAQFGFSATDSTAFAAAAVTLALRPL